MKEWNKYINENKKRSIEELQELLSIRSVSADYNYKDEVVRCAEVICKMLKEAACDFAEIINTNCHPVVFAQRIIDDSRPTILVYGHYDVQPPDPAELWDSDPFEPVVRNDKIIARGASDDKGQMFMHIKALETMVASNTQFCNIKFIIEGEEEIGSRNLEKYLLSWEKNLAADTVLVSDTTMISLERPSIETALRGLVYMQVELTGSNRDLLSGIYGGAVANPITMLCRMIASLHDKDNRITIPGFYDKVVTLSYEERSEINNRIFDLDDYKQKLGIKEIFEEKGFTTLESVGIRPSLDVNGIWGGYSGQGAKTVLPAKAAAKI
jgi:acetylornithine deacetylase/succinyl-diaminopimelate desuccinylase-like protein